MKQDRSQLAFTLLELMIVVAIIGILSALTGPLMKGTLFNSKTRSATRSVADLMVLARAKAMQTGTPHLVFFGKDTTGNILTLSDGRLASILVVADGVSTDCSVTAGEETWGLPAFDNGIAFQRSAGVARIATDVGLDATTATGTSFTFGSSNTNASWISFGADGIPRRFSTGANCDAGDPKGIGRGGGAVYVSGAIPGKAAQSGRQYAIELSPLGGVKTHRYDWGVNAWRTN